MDGAAGVVPSLYAGPLRDRDGLLLGRVEDVLFDAETNRAAWLVVRLGGGDEGAVARGARRTLAPARGLRFLALAGGGCALACEAARVDACPVALSAGATAAREEIAAAARHYGVRRFLRGDAPLTTAGRAAVAEAGDGAGASAALAVA